MVVMKQKIEAIAYRAKQALEKSGIKNKDLASRIKKSGATITDYLSGSIRIPVTVVAEISEITRTPLDWIIKGVGPGPGETSSQADVDPDPPTINEQQTTYTRAETRDESYLLRVYRQLTYDQQQAILDHADALNIAKESRRNVGGGSDLDAEKSAQR